MAAGENNDEFLVVSNDLEHDKYLYETERNDVVQTTGFLFTVKIFMIVFLYLLQYNILFHLDCMKANF